jgi:hypothetical protein
MLKYRFQWQPFIAAVARVGAEVVVRGIEAGRLHIIEERVEGWRGVGVEEGAAAAA